MKFISDGMIYSAEAGNSPIPCTLEDEEEDVAV
jgi:hypothetical protein